jgi:hypothetical protein
MCLVAVAADALVVVTVGDVVVIADVVAAAASPLERLAQHGSCDLPRLYDGDFARLLVDCSERVAQMTVVLVAYSSLEPSQ